MRTLVAMFFAAVLFLGVQECFAADCAGTGSGVGSLSSQKKVLFVWAKTTDDASVFPNWSNVLPTTLSDFYQVMSYNQHTVTTKIAIPPSYPSGGFWVSNHDVSHYKTQYQSLPSGHSYLGPWGIFVEEILLKIQQTYGATFFDDVDIIMMLNTNGGFGWYYNGDPTQNNTGTGALGVDFLTANGKFFDRWTGGVCQEFGGGEAVTKWGVCHEYGHTLGLHDRDAEIGVYSLMQNTFFYGANSPVAPLGVMDLIELGWLDVNDPSRVMVTSSNANITLSPSRNANGVVALKIFFGVSPPPFNRPEYFLISNLQQTNSTYDAIYPSSGLLVYHYYGIPLPPWGYSLEEDIKCAEALDPTIYGFNFDHLKLPQNDSNFHGEGLATDLFSPLTKNQFTAWTNPNTDGPLHDPNPGVAITDIAYGANGDMTFQVRFDFNSGTITADSWWKDSEVIPGATTLNAGKTLKVTSGSNVTINPGAAFSVNGDLSLEANGNISVQGSLTPTTSAVINGGGTVVTSGNGKIYSTSSAQATAFNSSRKLVRDASGNYHLVYENNGEICYEKRPNSGNALSEFRRLSNGNGSNKFPSITERSGKLYVVWQRQTGSFTYDIQYAHSSDGGLTWLTQYVLASASFTSATDPLPVIQASIPSANKLMVVFRGGSGVAITSRYYLNSGDLNASPQNSSEWTIKQVSGTTASSARNPSLAYRTNETGNFQVTWDNGNHVFYRKFDGTSWVSETNLTSSLGTAANAHQYSSFSVSADDRRHVVWQARDPALGNFKVVYHRELGGTVYTKFYGNNLDFAYPSVTGMTNSSGYNSAAVVFWYDDNGTNRNVRSAFYTGTCWDNDPFGLIQANNAIYVSSAISNPPSSSTRAVWRKTGSAPYVLGLTNTITSGGIPTCSEESALPKNQSQADSGFVYSRQLLFTLDSTAALALRLFAPEITGANTSLDFPKVADSDSLTAATLLNKLLFDFAVPANAEELKLNAEVFAIGAGRLLQSGKSNLKPGFEVLDQNNRRLALVEVGEVNLQGEFELTKTITLPIKTLRGKNVRLRPTLSNLDLMKVGGALVHAYGPQDIGAQSNSSEPAPPPNAQSATAAFVSAHPNPFNPSTQIRFVMPEAGFATLRLFNMNGQLVRELVQEERNAGEHLVTWDGRNENGAQAASGVYFIHFEAVGQKQVSKLTLMR